MTKREVWAALERAGLRIDTSFHSMSALADFCKQMEHRHYGAEETRDAFQWFEAGFNAAKARLD